MARAWDGAIHARLKAPGQVRLQDRTSIPHNRWFVCATLQFAQPVGNRLACPDRIVVRQVVASPRMHRVSCPPTSRYAR